jgi:uncharacterized protein YneF (UPF0154 family)
MTLKVNYQLVIYFVLLVLLTRGGYYFLYGPQQFDLQAIKSFGFLIVTDLLLLSLTGWLALRYRPAILSMISKILGSLTPRDLQNISQPSPEIRNVVNHLRSFVEQVSKTEGGHEIEKRSLPDSIGRELSRDVSREPSVKIGQDPSGSRAQLPYSIQAIVIRYSFSDSTRKALFESRMDFSVETFQYFEKMKELRLRYGGLDYQFFGDEKVLFFKVENGDQIEEQLLRAVAFLRDAFNLGGFCLGVEKVPAIFKAAVEVGSLTFYEMGGNYYFCGNPLTDSSKNLVGIQGQSSSIFSLPTVHNEKIKLLCRPAQIGVDLPKGQEAVPGMSYFSKIDENFSPEKDPMHFLSDKGLCQALDVFSHFLDSDQSEKFMLVFQKIRGVRTEVVISDIVTRYENLLIQTIRKFKEVEVENKVLSCVISLSWVFVPTGAENGQIKEQLYNLVRHKDIRVASNALMASQRYEWNDEVITKMLSSPSNRLRGDALLLLGRRGVEERFYRAWKRSVESKDSLFVVSGLWASQEVFKFHLENNPGHIKANILIEKMMEIIGRLKKSSQKQIAQRACWAFDTLSVNGHIRQ